MGARLQNIGNKAHPQPADPTDAGEDLLPGVSHDLMKQRAIHQPPDHLFDVVDMAVVAGKQFGEVVGLLEGFLGRCTVTVEVCAGSGQTGDLSTDVGNGGDVVGHPHIGTCGLVDMDFRTADVERGELLGLGTLDERGTGDDHVGLLGHVDPIADERHVAPPGDAVSKHAGDLGNPVGGQQGVHLEDVSRTGLTGEAVGLLRQEESGAVHEVDHRNPKPERHLLGALNLLGGLRPPGTAGDGVLVGDHHHPLIVNAAERSDHTGTGSLTTAARKLPSPVDQGANVEGLCAGVDERSQPLGGGHLALAVGVLCAPSLTHGLAFFQQRGLKCGEMGRIGPAIFALHQRRANRIEGELHECAPRRLES